MTSRPTGSRRYLLLTFSGTVGLAIGLLAAQGCGTQATGGKLGDPCSSSSPCGTSLVCTQGTCQSPSGTDGGNQGTDAGVTDGGMTDGGTPDGGSSCGTAPVTDCSACADGTACTDDGNACTQDICQSGTCAHPQVTAGTDCGAGEVCNNVGVCRAGCFINGQLYAAGDNNPASECQLCDPTTSVTSWTNASSQTPCANDGNSCTADLCNQGTCTHPPVSPGTACGTTGQCDSSGNCSQGCTIGGQFYADGTVNSNNLCQICDVTKSGSAWSSRPDGLACASDGDPCTTDACTAGACTHTGMATGSPCGTGKVCDASDTCVAQCFISGQLYAAQAPNPSNPCQVCDPATSTTAWSNAANGANCDDGNLCNGIDTCSAGACQQSTPPVTCNAAPSCRSNPGTCTPATGACTYAPDRAGTTCASGMICDGSGHCLADCYIGGNVITGGTVDPTNACLICDPTTSTSTWTARSAGTSCSPGKVCNTAQACIAGCFIGGNVYTNRSPNPSNQCQLCVSTTSTTSWSNATQGTVCASDGNNCTSDVCDGSGTCSHPATSGASCGAGLVCNGTQCMSGCYINGSFYAPGYVNTNNVCQVCTPNTSTTAWSNNASATCSDGNNCTMNDACVNQTCQGTAYTCTPSGPCQTSVCNGTGGCTTGNKPAGTACGAGSCQATEYCNSTGVCDRCTSSGSSCCTVNIKTQTFYCASTGLCQ